MGKGIDLAREDAPIHAQMLDDLKDQLLIAFLHRLGDKISMSASEIDRTGEYNMAFSVDVGTRTFHFELRKKQ